MILKYALFRAQKLLASVKKQFTVTKTQTFSGILLDSNVQANVFWIWCIFSLYFPLVGFNTRSRETEALCTAFPEELEVLDEDPFDEEDAIFYLGSQSTRQRVVLGVRRVVLGVRRVVLGVRLAGKQGLKLRNVTTTAVNPSQAQLIISNKHSRNIILSRELYSIQNYENCSHRGSKRADYAGSAFL